PHNLALVLTHQGLTECIATFIAFIARKGGGVPVFASNESFTGSAQTHAGRPIGRPAQVLASIAVTASSAPSGSRGPGGPGHIPGRRPAGTGSPCKAAAGSRARAPLGRWSGSARRTASTDTTARPCR